MNWCSEVPVHVMQQNFRQAIQNSNSPFEMEKGSTMLCRIPKRSA